MKLKDKVAIIAGGTKGIGLGIALEYIREGAKVVVGGSTEKNGQAAVEEIRAAGGECLFVKCDVSSLADLDNIIGQTVKAFGRLDIYVANAGINDANNTNFLDITPELYDRIMDVNLKGMFFGGQKAAQQMVDQGDGGVIINMSSVNAYLALDSQVVYTTSKGGIQQLTKVQAVALAPHKIKVNAIAPGPIETDLMRGSVRIKNLLTRYCHVRHWDELARRKSADAWPFSSRARTPTLFSANPSSSMAAGDFRPTRRLDTEPSPMKTTSACRTYERTPALRALSSSHFDESTNPPKLNRCMPARLPVSCASLCCARISNCLFGFACVASFNAFIPSLLAARIDVLTPHIFANRNNFAGLVGPTSPA